MADLDGNATDQSSAPVVIILGDFSHEGIKAKVETLGFTLLNKRFRSSPSNWHRIVKFIRTAREVQRLVLVLGYIPSPTLLFIADPEYDGVRELLLNEMELVPTLLFIYEDNLQGKFDPFPWEVGDELETESESADSATGATGNVSIEDAKWLEENEDRIAGAQALLKQLMARNIEVVPFRKRSDVMIRMFEALEDIHGGVFLRVYVPHGRYQSEQFEDFLSLFSRYLREVEGREFSIDAQRTARGTTYVFKGRGEVKNIDEFREATSRFDRFLLLAESDTRAAESMLVSGGMPLEDAGFIAAKYARAFRRLHLETRQEYERRRLTLTHQMESDFLEARQATLLPMPQPNQTSALLAVVGNLAPVTISLQNATLAAGDIREVAQTASSVDQYSTEDKEILALIAKLPDEVEALRLRSELDRLRDVGTPTDERRTAAQKLKTFLYSSARYLGRKADEVGTKLLVAYLEHQLRINNQT